MSVSPIVRCIIKCDPNNVFYDDNHPADFADIYIDFAAATYRRSRICLQTRRSNITCHRITVEYTTVVCSYKSHRNRNKYPAVRLARVVNGYDY